MECFRGQTKNGIRVFGKRESSMEQVSTLMQLERSKKETGSMESYKGSSVISYKVLTQ